MQRIGRVLKRAVVVGAVTFAAGFFGANVLLLGCVGASFEGTLAPRWLLLLMGGGLVGPRPLRGAALFERGMDAVRYWGG